MFVRGNDSKLESLNIGKVNLIKSWLKSMNIYEDDYKINEDLTIDLYANHNFRFNKNLIIGGCLPEYIQFNVCVPDFHFSNLGLTSLKGSPYKVLGTYFCSYNPWLISLEYAPKFVQGNFMCTGNPNINSKIVGKYFEENTVNHYQTAIDFETLGKKYDIKYKNKW